MTQKYDKVVWQDETTSQQGTLINAERLDQMQTAHHYADGFEEVDEVPTEDPGVDYHKVVYCTADTTFYRWNGEEWTKDVDDDTKALLLAHEADHANPHVVTKAQVGLGNCDNTSDLAKPISTATQTALDAKVDDSQIKSTWSSPLSNDNIPGEKLVKDTLDTKADKATTLAGYGITDAVDTTSAQTVGGAKTFTGQLIATGQRAYDPANTNDVATIGTLNAYTPMVRTSGNQTIGGTKTLTNPPMLEITSNLSSIEIKTASYDVTDGIQHFLPDVIKVKDKNNVQLMKFGLYSFPNGRVQLKAYVRNSDGTFKGVTIAEGDTIA